MVDPVAITLAILYFILFFTGSYQLLDIVMSNNKKRSQKNMILSFLTLGSILRIVFWIKVTIPTTISDRVMIVIFFLPLWFNFVGLSGLAVFYAKALDLTQAYRRIPIKISIAANIILLLLNFVISITLTNDHVSEDVVVLGALYIAYATCLDLMLAGILAYLGNKFMHSPAMKNILPESVELLGLVNWIVVSCYTVRGIFTPIFVILPSTEIEFNGHHRDTSLISFFFFVITEVLPNLCVMVLLWKLGGKTAHRYSSFTIKSLDRLLDQQEEQDIEDDDKYFVRDELTTTLLESYRETSDASLASHQVSWHNTSSSNEARLPSYSNQEVSAADPLVYGFSHAPEQHIRQLPSEHGMLAEEALNLSAHHAGMMLSTPSPQLIQVGTSYESSPGGAEYMWQQIYSHQNAVGLASVAYSSSSFQHSQSPSPAPAIVDPRRSFQSDRSDGSLPKKASPLHEASAAAGAGNVEKYGNYLSPRDILLMAANQSTGNPDPVRSVKK
jgi:hypothetical protein